MRVGPSERQDDRKHQGIRGNVQVEIGVEGQPGGTFQVTCLDGDISTLPLQGGSGQLLEAGQSVSISARGRLVARKQSGVKSSGSSHTGVLRDRTGWTLLGLAAGAGAAGSALNHGGATPVSPSTP